MKETLHRILSGSLLAISTFLLSVPASEYLALGSPSVQVVIQISLGTVAFLVGYFFTSLLRASFVFVGIIIITLVYTDRFAFRNRRSPTIATKFEIEETAEMVRTYYKRCGAPPSRLEDLVQPPAACSDRSPLAKTTPMDGWNSNFEYKILKDNRVQLKSLGGDKAEGGSGENVDRILEFDANGDEPLNDQTK